MNGKTIMAVSAVASAFALQAQEAAKPELVEEEKSPFSVEASVDVLSDYVWRGMILNDNPVWQPAVTLSYGSDEYGRVAASVWSTFDLTHKRGTETASRRDLGCQEIDYTLSYSIEFGGLGFELGHIWYQFPNGNGSSDEDLYAVLSYDNEYVTPSLGVYWNYSHSAGNRESYVYWLFGLEREFALSDELTVTPFANLGLGTDAMTDSGEKFTDCNLGVKASYALSDNVSLGAQLTYTAIPTHTLRNREYMGRDKDELLWGGVNVTFSF